MIAGSFFLTAIVIGAGFMVLFIAFVGLCCIIAGSAGRIGR